MRCGIVRQYKWVAPVATTFTVVLLEPAYSVNPTLYLDTDGTLAGLRGKGALGSCEGTISEDGVMCIVGGAAKRNQNFVIKVRTEVLGCSLALYELHNVWLDILPYRWINLRLKSCTTAASLG